MKNLVFVLLLLIASIVAEGQNYIGAHKLQIKKEMKENYKDFYFSKEVMGKNNFIKFEDYDGFKTILFVLDEEGYCTYSVLMCDYAFLKETVDSLNQHYEYKNDLTWVDYFTGKDNYQIKLKKKEWFFSVVTRRLEENK